MYCDYGCPDKKSMMGHYDRNHQGEKISLEWLKSSLAVCRYWSFGGSEEAIIKHIASRHSKLVVNIQRIQVKIV